MSKLAFVKISNETKVGSLTVIAITVLIIGYNFLKGKDLFTNTVDYYAKYENINGIKVSNAILYNGFNVGKVTALDLNEKGIYDTLINIAGLQKEVDNNFNETKQQLKNRLELVEGSIGAGNTNPALKKELHALLGKMAHTGMIGYGDAKKHYLSVCRNV